MLVLTTLETIMEIAVVKKDLTAYERRESIKTLLVKERSTTVPRLAYLYDVCTMTIKRDLLFLSNCIPIETKSGNGGGVFLNMEFESRKQYLTNKEKNLLERLSKELSNDTDKLLIKNIINKFSIPNGE